MKGLLRFKTISFLIVILFMSVIGLIPCHASAGEDEWEYFTKIENGKYFLYIDTHNLSYSSENIVICKAKQVPSPEWEKEIRKTFDEANKEAEQEFNTKVQHPDLLLNMIMKNETREYMCEIDCANNKFRLLLSFIIEIAISPDCAEGQLLKKFCKDKKTGHGQ